MRFLRGQSGRTMYTDLSKRLYDERRGPAGLWLDVGGTKNRFVVCVKRNNNITHCERHQCIVVDESTRRKYER